MNNNDYSMQAAQQQNSVMATQAESQAVAEVRTRVQVAKMFPRNEFEAETRIMKACERRSLAEQSQYIFPRGGQDVTGPSIRLAETIASNWGNLDYGTRVLEQNEKETVMEAYAWDLETNTRRTMTFTVPHERSTKRGMQKLTDPRDIYEIGANNGSRRVRACILALIPGEIIEMAVEKCNETLKSGDKVPLDQRIKNMLAKFEEEWKVKQDWIEKMIGKKASSFSEQHMIRLGKIYRSLTDEMSKVEDHFGDYMDKPTTSVNSSAQAQFEAAKASMVDPKPNSGTEGDPLA